MYFVLEELILLFLRTWSEVLVAKYPITSYKFTENIYFVKIDTNISSKHCGL